MKQHLTDVGKLTLSFSYKHAAEMHVYELISSSNVGINITRHFLMFVSILLCFESLPKNIEASRKLSDSVVAMFSSAVLMILFSCIKDVALYKPTSEKKKKKSVNCVITYPPYTV